MTVQTWTPGMPERPCGDEHGRCSMCCRLPAAPPSPQLPEGKPGGAWCRHCAIGKGCRIYQQRPEGCREYACLWKIMPDFPEPLRPDKCKVMWQLSEDGRRAIASTEYPKALESTAQRQLAARFRAQGIAVRANIVRPAARGSTVPCL